MRTICIDARFWGTKHTGIGRYTQNLVKNLTPTSEYKLVLVCSIDEKSNPDLQDYEVFWTKYHPYSIMSQYEMYNVLSKINPDLTHFTHFSAPILWKKNYIVTIHDLIKHQYSSPSSTRSGTIQLIKSFGYKVAIRSVIAHSKKIIVPTNYTKSEILRVYPSTLSENIIVTYEGISSNFFKQANRSIDLPDKPYLIYTGNAYPHKNLPILLKALKELSGEILLFIISSRGVFTQRLNNLISELEIEKFTKIMSNVTDDQLIYLYNNAFAFVFPSKIEGFGLPGLEAMAAGCPVISSNASCLPEVYDNAALFFDPDSLEELVQSIKSLQENSDQRKDLIKKGLKKSKEYSWIKMGKQTWETYQKILQ